MIPMTLADVARAVGALLEPSIRDDFVTRVVTDSRDVHRGDLFVALSGSRVDGHEFIPEAFSKGASACVCRRDKGCTTVLSKRISSDKGGRLLEVDDTVESLGRLAAYYRMHVMSPQTAVVGVTGSNGKTTTKCMLDQVLCATFPGRASPKSFNNHLGVPLTLLSVEESDRYVIVEIGTNAPGEVAMLAAMVSPTVGVITSIGEAHLEGLGSALGVAAEKASLLDHIRPGGLAVVNIDRTELVPHLHRNPRLRCITTGRSEAARLRVTGVSGGIHGTICELDGRYRIQLPMPGMHHATNAAAVFAVARWFGLDPSEIAERLSSFRPPEGRTAICDFGGWTVIDDTYNANPASVAAAIQALQGERERRRVFVLGDMLELGEESRACHGRAVEEVVGAGIEVLVAVGPSTCEAARTAVPSASGTYVVECSDTAAAIGVLHGLLCPGDVVWLKASRGMRLERIVESLQTQPATAAA